jgi:type IV pilus assembly protein PilB
LSELNDAEDKIITTEDPMEYDIEGIVQVPIDSALVSPLRPACGRFCGKTLTAFWSVRFEMWKRPRLPFRRAHRPHGVSPRSTPTTLQPRSRGCATWVCSRFLITATVEAILAQRLVRRICANCIEEYVPDADILADLESDHRPGCYEEVLPWSRL